MTPELPAGPEHWGPGSEPHDRRRDSVLGPADPEEMAWAAEELRARTMRLEQIKLLPPLRFVLITFVVVFTLVALMLVFRSELRHLFRLHGL